MKILVWFLKFFAFLTTIALIFLITYTTIAFGVKKEVTKDKIKDYLFNITYTDKSINNMVNTYEIKDALGYTDYLSEIVIDKAFETSNFKKDMGNYLTDIIYENKTKSDKKTIEKIVNENIIKNDSNNRITKETQVLMVNTINDYVNNIIDNNINKNEKTTYLLNTINHLLNINIVLMALYIFGLCLILIIFTISLIRPIKYIGISTIISGLILASTKLIEGPLINIFIKGETNLLEASKTLVNNLFNEWFKLGIGLILLGITLYIIFKILLYIFDSKNRKKLQRERKIKQKEKKKVSKQKPKEIENKKETKEIEKEIPEKAGNVNKTKTKNKSKSKNKPKPKNTKRKKYTKKEK